MTYCLGIEVQDGSVCLADGPWVEELIPNKANARLSLVQED